MDLLVGVCVGGLCLLVSCLAVCFFVSGSVCLYLCFWHLCVFWLLPRGWSAAGSLIRWGRWILTCCRASLTTKKRGFHKKSGPHSDTHCKTDMKFIIAIKTEGEETPMDFELILSIGRLFGFYTLTWQCIIEGEKRVPPPSATSSFWRSKHFWNSFLASFLYLFLKGNHHCIVWII